MFHIECIDDWLVREGTCPTCRISVPPLEIAPPTTITSVASRRTTIPASIWENLRGKIDPLIIVTIGTVVGIYGIVLLVTHHGHF